MDAGWHPGVRNANGYTVTDLIEAGLNKYQAELYDLVDPDGVAQTTVALLKDKAPDKHLQDFLDTKIAGVKAVVRCLQEMHNLAASNCLQNLPDSLTQLVHLQDLNVSGNAIASLPEGIGALTALKNLALHGNRLTSLPEQGWQHLDHLDEITLQGNLLTEVPPTLAELKGLTELSLADNQLRSLPDDLSGLTRLQKFHLYGNQLTYLPMGVGLDDQQVAGPAAAEYDRLKAAGNRSVRKGTVQVSKVIFEDDLSSAGLPQCMSQLPLGLCR
eukprot:gene2503-2807_t